MPPIHSARATEERGETLTIGVHGIVLELLGIDGHRDDVGAILAVGFVVGRDLLEPLGELVGEFSRAVDELLRALVEIVRTVGEAVTIRP